MANVEKNTETKRTILFSPPDISELEVEELQKHFVLDGLQLDREQRNLKRD